MKTFLPALLALCLALAPSAAAQQGGGRPGGAPGARPGGGPGFVVAGTVLDAETGEPIPTATIAVWNAADSTLATGAIASADGRFEIEGIRPGRYYVRVSFVGYATETVDGVAVGPQQPRADLGAVRLTVDTALLDEVEVSAARDFMEVHLDKNVYNTRDQIVSQGGSATDVLRNIPAVEVDLDGNISLRGSQNVAVLINGRPAQMTGEMLASFLQGLPASTIERVEVIPNPSARYEPDGMSGILNLVLKQDADLGLGGSVTAGAGTRDRANVSTMLSYGKGPLSARATYGFRYGERETEGTRFNEYRTGDPFEYLEVLNTGTRHMLSHTLNLSTDYRLTRRSTVSLSALASARGGDGDDRNDYAEWLLAQDPTARYARSTEETEADLSLDLGLAFKHTIEPAKHELSAELRLERQREDEEQRYRQEVLGLTGGSFPTLLEESEMDEGIDEASLQLDYVRPLGAEGRVELGYKGAFQVLDNDYFAATFDDALGSYVPDLAQAFHYEQQVHAAYAIVGQQLGRVGLQAGLRAEQAMTNFDLSDLSTAGAAYENDYFSLFPSAFVTYKASDVHQFRASYSKRINRPRVSGWMNQLSPLTDRSDPLYRREGNPYLRPEYVHSFELTYTRTGAATSLTLSPYFRRTVDVIRFIDRVDDATGVTTVTFQNLDQSDAWGAEAIGTLRLGSRLNAFASFNAYRVNTDGSSLSSSLSNDAFGWATRLNATLKLTPTLDMQASWFYRAPMNVEQGRMGAMKRTDVALRQRLLGDRASLSLRVDDPFRMAGFRMERDTPAFYLENTRTFDSPSIGLSFTYNFGRQDRAGFNRRRGGNPEDRGPVDEIPMGY